MQSNRTFQFISDPNHKVRCRGDVVKIIEIITANRDEQENLSGRVTAACLNCRRKKIKCDGDRDCEPCRQKGLVCEGPSSRKRASGDGDLVIAATDPANDEVSDLFAIYPMHEAAMENQNARYDTFQQLLSSVQPTLGRESAELNPNPASHYASTTSAWSGGEAVGARPSRSIYPMPSRHPPHQDIAPTMERRLEDGESRPRRSAGHLLQEAEVLEGKAGWLRQLASLRLHDEAMAVHIEVQRHEEQQQQDQQHQKQQYQQHQEQQQQQARSLPSSQQPRSRPSNPNQTAFGCVASPDSMSSSAAEMDWRPPAYQFDASTIFRPDGVTLRTGLTARGGEFGTWDRVDMQPSHSQSIGQQHQQHRLDFSTSPSHRMQQQQQQQQQAPHSSEQQSALPTGSDRSKSRFKQGSDDSGSTATSSSSTTTKTPGQRRMQAAFHTQLAAQRFGVGDGEGTFRAYHPHDVGFHESQVAAKVGFPRNQ
ncbi:hypothetical protein LTR17_009974 [Elasticomyces elasticus]|nr:hypothetical protein LTR17_009974 [Elasticomyces elasticus]